MNACASIDFNRLFASLAANPLGAGLLFASRVNEQELQPTDAELIRRIAARDRAAFAELYDRHATLMFSVAIRILNEAGEAEDVLQETFLQIWDKAGNFDPDLGKASSWAATLTRNKAIDRLRASQRRNLLIERAGVESVIATEVSGTVNEGVYGRANATLIQSAVTDLPPEQRQAIELAYFSGLTQEEISEKLNTPLGTIKARIRRGLLKMRDKLEGLL